MPAHMHIIWTSSYPNSTYHQTIKQNYAVNIRMKATVCTGRDASFFTVYMTSQIRKTLAISVVSQRKLASHGREFNKVPTASWSTFWKAKDAWLPKSAFQFLNRYIIRPTTKPNSWRRSKKNNGKAFLTALSPSIAGKCTIAITWTITTRLVIRLNNFTIDKINSE